MEVFTTFSKVISAASKTAFIFSITCLVSAVIFSKTNSPVVGLMAICPEVYNVFPIKIA